MFVIGKLTSLTDFGELWYGSAAFVCDSSEPQPVLAICGSDLVGRRSLKLSAILILVACTVFVYPLEHVNAYDTTHACPGGTADWSGT